MNRGVKTGTRIGAKASRFLRSAAASPGTLSHSVAISFSLCREAAEWIVAFARVIPRKRPLSEHLLR